MITIEDFQKVEIKVGTIENAEKVEWSDKLLKLIFNFGSEKRQVLAGISKFYPDPNTLIGKQLPVITNLEPRKIKDLVSEGMIVATDDKDGNIVFLTPEKEIDAGSLLR